MKMASFNTIEKVIRLYARLSYERIKNIVVLMRMVQLIKVVEIVAECGTKKKRSWKYQLFNTMVLCWFLGIND